MEKPELVAAGGISPVRTDPDLVNTVCKSLSIELAILYTNYSVLCSV